MKRSRFHTMLWAGERAALRSWAFSVLMEEPYVKENRKGLQKRAREWWATLVCLYVAREPPSTSLATVLAQKDRSFTCWSFASRTRSLATPFTHSLESDSITLWRIIRSSLYCYYPQGAQQPRCILEYRNRKKRSVAIRTTGKVSLT